MILSDGSVSENSIFPEFISSPDGACYVLANVPPLVCVRRRAGFTLIEVLLVLMILAIVAGLGTVAYFRMQTNALNNAAKTTVRGLEQNLEMYQLDVGHFPTKQEGGLQALMQAPPNAKRWKGPYIKKLDVDPWGNAYEYEPNGNSVKIWSWGPDSVDNSGDEVSNLTS